MQLPTTVSRTYGSTIRPVRVCSLFILLLCVVKTPAAELTAPTDSPDVPAQQRATVQVARQLVTLLDSPLKQCLEELSPEMLQLHREIGVTRAMLELLQRHGVTGQDSASEQATRRDELRTRLADLEQRRVTRLKLSAESPSRIASITNAPAK
ncbi:MAG: hypothetical protein KDB23_05285 [Planctomycetales bacterium]|nr:hypothetical protein [Planctomycetales bacterium]